jgi:hypothetical protein
MKKFVKAEEGPENSVVYYDEDDNKFIRYWKRHPQETVKEASTRSWRNNNPGNIQYNDLQKKRGAIGKAGDDETGRKLAVFPDYATGRKAHELLLKGSVYINLTLNELPKKYTGVEVNKPDTAQSADYKKSIRIFTKLDMERAIRSLNDEEFETLLDAMKNHEGWREGKEEYIEVKKVLGAHLDKKRTIFEYLIGNKTSNEWISKKEAITLAETGILHAIVVHVKNKKYLRPKYHQTSFRQMVY